MNNLLMDLSKSGIDGMLDEEGNLTLGDTTFQQMLKEHLPHLKKATNKHLQSCCCEICLTMMKMHAELLRWRQKIKEMKSNLATETEMVNHENDMTVKTVMMSLVNRKNPNLSLAFSSVSRTMSTNIQKHPMHCVT